MFDAQGYGKQIFMYVRQHAEQVSGPAQHADSHTGDIMNNTYSKTQLVLAVACALAFGFATSAARADGMSANSERELWNDTSVKTWKNAYGECWHNNYGPPPGYNECNPAPLAQYVAPAPAPYVAPVVIAAAAPQPVYEKVSLDANILFDFDKSVLKPAGRATLDNFVDKIKGFDSTSIAAIGFADRFGTDNYNQALSERRVATVKNYLVSKGVEPKWGVHSSAKGESQPTTAMGECKGTTPNATNIACLQPDRHVSVEFAGTRLKQ
jgi:OOP family OmpA-OmpF porin